MSKKTTETANVFLLPIQRPLCIPHDGVSPFREHQDPNLKPFNDLTVGTTHFGKEFLGEDYTPVIFLSGKWTRIEALFPIEKDDFPVLC